MLLDYERMAKAIKNKGFKFIKVELESDINYDGVERIGECDQCKGKGKIRSYQDRRRLVRCGSCEGTGNRLIYIEDYDDFGRVLLRNIPKEIKDGNIFWYPYHDGSVNTEITFTIPVELIKYLPATLEAFRELAEDSGGMDNGNAGMHITLMEDSNYPELKDLPGAKIRNFRQSMEKVVTSLYPLASADTENTRGMSFRYCKIGVNHSDKYSAIFTHNDTCIEYRLFDTCYENPERLSLFFNTIVKSLRYYDLTINLNEVEYTGMILPYFNSWGRISSLYPAKSDVMRLLKELIHIHPEPKLVQHLLKRFESGAITKEFVIKNLTRR